jgi:tetratricopeptide (TPR) repeat protein
MDYANAFPYLINAADEASKAYSSTEAIELFTRAKEILGDYSTQEDIGRLYAGLGYTYLFLGQIDKALSTYEEMYELAESVNDEHRQILALNQLGFINVIALGDLEKGDSLLVKAENLAKSCNFELGLAENYMIKCNVETATANFDEVKVHLEEAVSIGEKLNETRPLLYGKTHVANTLVYMTRFDEAKIQAQETKEIAIQRGDKEFYSELLAFTIPFCHLRDGEIDRAYEVASEGLAMSQEIGHIANIISASMTLANIVLLRGNYEEALRMTQIAVEGSKNIGISGYVASILSSQADIQHQICGPDEEIENYFQEVFSLMIGTAGNFLGGKIWSEYGFFKLSQNKPDSALEFFDKVITIATTPMYLFEPIAYLGKAIAWMIKGEMEQSNDWLDKAEKIVEDKRMKYLLPMLYLIKSKYHTAINQIEESITNLESAEMYAEEMKFRPILWEIKLDLSKLYQDPSRAQLKRDEVTTIIDEINDDFSDETLRDKYRSKVKSMLDMPQDKLLSKT